MRMREKARLIMLHYRFELLPFYDERKKGLSMNYYNLGHGVGEELVSGVAGGEASTRHDQHPPH
jgi:hypothetical protein